MKSGTALENSWSTLKNVQIQVLKSMHNYDDNTKP